MVRERMLTPRKILAVEDEAAIRRGVVDALRYAGFEAYEAATGIEGLRMALEMEYDLLLLDLVLPERDGLEILREVRKFRPTQPVIILTARGDESDRVAGLRLGADDYVIKPFSVKELLARVEAVLRRSPERPNKCDRVEFAGGVVHLARCEVTFTDGTRADLSEKEVEILRYLAANAGRAISRDELLLRVWQLDPRGLATRTIDMHITRLREKLRDDPQEPQVVRTVRGKGYMFGNARTNATTV